MDSSSIHRNRPNPGNYNLSTDEGKLAYNKIIDDYYKAHGYNFAPLIVCDIYADSRKNSHKASQFKFTSTLHTPGPGKYDSNGNPILTTKC